MGYKLGVVTLGSSGLLTINVGAPSTPTGASIVVQNKSGVAESIKHVSIGSVISGNQRVTSYFKDVGSPTTFDSTSKVIAHYERVGGAVTEVLSASFDSFTSSGIKLNVTIPNVDYDVYLRVDY